MRGDEWGVVCKGLDVKECGLWIYVEKGQWDRVMSFWITDALIKFNM